MRSKNPEYFKLIEDFINEYRDTNGTVPSNAEMSVGTGLSSATVSRYLAKMKEDGLISYDGHRTLQTKMMQRSRDAVALPVFSTAGSGIAASVPVTAFSTPVMMTRTGSSMKIPGAGGIPRLIM